jgi:hypothetical protein
MRPLQMVCSGACAIEYNNQLKSKQQRKDDKARKERLKTRRDWLKDAQSAFNRFVRARDYGKTCICCDKPLGEGDIGGNYDAGHYRSVGSAPHLRFDERNCHAQRKQCNRYGSGRAVDYRLGLIKRLGVDEVERLESDQEPRKYTTDELKAIKARYTAMARELEKQRGK